MKKRILLILFALFVALLMGIVACGKKPVDPTPDDPTPDNPVVKVDETAPVITFAQHGTLEVKVGETLRLPEAFANDDTDGDISSKVVPMSGVSGPELTAAEGVSGCVYDFMCHAKGEYQVVYKVVDEAGNNGTGLLTVNVTADRDDETEVSDELNRFENILVDGGTYSENFAKGYYSPMAELGLPQGMYLSTEEKAINGTSLIIEDFSNVIKFYAFAPFTAKEAYYTVSFDLKLVSGNGAGSFYVSFAEAENEMGVSDVRFPLNGLAVGEVTHFDTTFRLFGAQQYYFRFFVYNEETNMVIAIDNLTVSYKAPVPTYVPTYDELVEGYTWDWENSLMDVSFAEIVDRPQALEGVSGYSNKVLALDFPVGNGPQFFGTRGIFLPEYTYIIEFDYYTGEDAIGYNAYYNIARTTTTSVGNFTEAKGQSKHNTLRFTAQDGDMIFGLFLAGTVDGSNAKFYIGNLSVTVLPKYVVKFVSDGEVISEQKITKGEDAFAPTLSKDTAVFKGWDKEYTNVTEDITVTAIWKEKTNFVNPVVTYTGEESYTINKGDYLTIPVSASDDVDGDLTSIIDFTVAGAEVIFDATSQSYKFKAENVGSYTVYATVMDSSDNVSDPISFEVVVDGITDEYARDGKYTWDWTNRASALQGDYKYEIVDRPDVDALKAEGSGFSSKVVRVEFPAGGGGFIFADTADFFTVGKTYVVNFNVYAPVDTGHFNLYYCVYDATTTSIGNFSNGYDKGIVIKCRTTFTAQEGDRVFALYCAGVMALGEDALSYCYIGDFTIEDYSEPLTELVTDWSKKVNIQTGYPVEVVDRPDVDALKAEGSGFSSKVLRIDWTAGGDAVQFLDTADFITPGKTYEAKFNVYVPANSGHFNVYYCVFDTTRTSLENFSNGYDKGVILNCRVVFTAQPGDRIFALYCAGVMALGEDTLSYFYMGDLSVKEYKEPLKELVTDWTTEVKIKSPYPAEVVDRPDVDILKAEGSGFSSKVLRVDWTAGGDAVQFLDTADFITPGKTYEAIFNVYVPANSGHFNVYYCVFETTRTALGNFSNGYDKGIVIKCKTSFTAQEGDSIFALYCAGVMALGDDTLSYFYMGDLSIKESTNYPASSLLAEVGGKAFTDFEEYDEQLNGPAPFGGIYHQGAGTMIVEYNQIMGSKALHIDNSTSNGNNAHFLADIAKLPVGYYKVSFDLMVVNDAYAGAISIDLGSRYSPGGYVEVRIPKNTVLRVTKYFEIASDSAANYLIIWTGATNMFVDNLEIERVESILTNDATYYIKALCTAGGSITEDFETTYAANDCKFGYIYPTADASIADDNGNKVLKWNSGAVYFFLTEPYMPAGTYEVKMRIKKVNAEGVSNLYIFGTQVDASTVTTDWTTVTYTVTIGANQVLTFDSGVNPGYYIDDIVITRQ